MVSAQRQPGIPCLQLETENAQLEDRNQQPATGCDHLCLALPSMINSVREHTWRARRRSEKFTDDNENKNEGDNEEGRHMNGIH